MEVSHGTVPYLEQSVHGSDSVPIFNNYPAKSRGISSDT